MKPGLNTYKKAYATCEEGLKIKGEATSAQLLNWLIDNYNKLKSIKRTSNLRKLKNN